jgi:hypothetical protein
MRRGSWVLFSRARTQLVVDDLMSISVALSIETSGLLKSPAWHGREKLVLAANAADRWGIQWWRWRPVKLPRTWW